MRGHKLSKRPDQRRFSKTADRTHAKNVLRTGVMRGGYRI